jgi:hypothetical protein
VIELIATRSLRGLQGGTLHPADAGPGKNVRDVMARFRHLIISGCFD